jgi:hypothetical protein
VAEIAEDYSQFSSALLSAQTLHDAELRARMGC